MIREGKCGAFNPLLLECLDDIADSLEAAMERGSLPSADRHELWSLTQEALRSKKVMVSERSLRLMDHERMKHDFFADMSNEIQFEYTASPPTLTLSSYGANKLGLEGTIADPCRSESVLEIMGSDAWCDISQALRESSPDQPVIHYKCLLHCHGQSRWHRIIMRAIWSGSEPPEYTGCIGKAVDIHDSLLRLEELEKQVSHDQLTGLLNQTYAKERILERMKQHPDQHFALVLCDLDEFKLANDTYGHIFGNRVLKHVAKKLRRSARDSDILARVGGDEFLLFLQYDTDIEEVINHIFSSALGVYKNFPISISMGVARTAVVGTDYDTLFHAADQALYSVKRSGRSRYCFYDESMKDLFSAISPIDQQDTNVTESIK